MNKEDICFMSAVEMKDKIASQEITSVEITETIIERIEKINKLINAYCTTTFDIARDAAKKADEAVKKGHFRDDLYYRLNVIRIQIPSLSERREDIPLLVNHFIDHFNRLQGKNIRKISEPALAALMTASLPGNIRELEKSS